MSVGIRVNRPAVNEARHLAARLAADDLSALAVLYDQHGGAVYRLALALLGREADAEDVLQDVFIGLLRRPRKMGDPRAYLLVAARNRAVSILRRRGREADDADQTIQLLERRGLDLNEAAIAAQIERSLGRLPAEQREVIVLRIYEGLSFPEIARVVRTNANTAASRYRYGVARLRELVGDDL